MKALTLILSATFVVFGAVNTQESAAKSGRQKTVKTNAVAHKALFDDFTYSGHDTMYDNQPLTGAGSYRNPILPGWYSDPSICRVGNDYFMVTSTFSYYPGIPVFHSRDLINWQQTGHVLDRESQLKLDGQAVNNGGIYAPAIAYNPKNETFYVITTNVGQGNFFVKTKNPYGRWSDPVMLPAVNGIDPSFFFDDDGKAYIVHDDAPDGTPDYSGHRVIRMHEFDVEREQTTGVQKVIVNKGVHPEEEPSWIEGPHLYKIGGKYCLMAAEGGTGSRHSEVWFTADKPFGPYTPAKQNPILTQRDLDQSRPDPVTCTGHADIVQTPQGDWWAVFLGCRPFNGQFENLGRETFLMPVRWNEDGSPVITAKGEAVPAVMNMPGAVRGTATTFGNFTKTDSFDSPKLGLEWMTLRGPATDLYSLEDYPGRLALRCAGVSTAEKAVPAYVGRRIQHHAFDCYTTITFNPTDKNETAGLLIFKNETRQYFLCIAKTDKGKAVELRKITDRGTETLATTPIKNKLNTLRLKIKSDGLHFSFYYSAPEGEWHEVAKNIDAGYLSTRHAGGFTGTTIGMYAVTDTKK